MPFGIGPLELVIVLVIILVIFGPKRLPQAGRALEVVADAKAALPELDERRRAALELVADSVVERYA